MSAEHDPAALVGRTADPSLLGSSEALLPADVRPPAPLSTASARPQLVAFGVTMTAATLIGGVALMALGVALFVAGAGTAGLAALVLGGVLAGTHWGWVHVTEIMSQRAGAQRDAPLRETRSHWLERIEPYPRYSITTEVAADGTIEILRVLHRPVPHGTGRFTFQRTVLERERHAGDTPGAVVTERAEQLRAQAAADTAAEHARYRAAAEAYQEAAMRTDDEAERQAAVRAAAQALSDQINANLRDGPLPE